MTLIFSKQNARQFLIEYENDDGDDASGLECYWPAPAAINTIFPILVVPMTPQSTAGDDRDDCVDEDNDYDDDHVHSDTHDCDHDHDHEFDAR